MKCTHKNLGHVEVIEAYNQTTYNDEGLIMFNNEYGHKIRDEVNCYECGKKWVVTKSSPKFIKKFHFKVQRNREIKMELPPNNK